MMDYRYDVLVCGAGIAGVAAALEAARAGLSVALIEKTILPGGLATSGLVYYYLPLCDGNGTQVTFGLAEELLKLSIKYGPGEVPQGWPAGSRPDSARYEVTFSPASFVLALDEALQDAGVTCWLDTLACSPVMNGNQVIGVEVETKCGRVTLTAPVTIDATGDADIAVRAGAACETCKNILSLWALQATLDTAREAVEQQDGTPLLSLYAFGGDGADPAIENAERVWQMETPREVTAFVLEGRRIMREHYRALQAGQGRSNVYLLTLPTMAQYRMTRRIVGRSTLQSDDAWQRFPDAVGLVADWRTRGSVWEIPYGTLLPAATRGLLAVGRCISSAGDAWHVTRVIPAAALTGQIAGLAARLAVEQRIDPADVDVAQLQQKLRDAGIPCRIDEVFSTIP